MSHKEQRDFCKKVKTQYPDHFRNVLVLDVGSQDINGNNRYLFNKGSRYIGVDLGAGYNVDIIGPVHQLPGEEIYDTIICTEMLEHDKYWLESLRAMYKLLKRGGLMICTAGGPEREEHGTHTARPKSSPFTRDYYGNITQEHLKEAYANTYWKDWYCEVVRDDKDINFFAVK
jgi:SAM-dependent methyltransferase